jgi:hypothetical protein
MVSQNGPGLTAHFAYIAYAPGSPAAGFVINVEASCDHPPMENQATLEEEIRRFVKGGHDYREISEDVIGERCELVAELITERVKSPLAWSVVFARDAHEGTEDYELWVLDEGGELATVRQEPDTLRFESRLIPLADLTLQRKAGGEGAWTVVARGKRAEFSDGDDSIPVALTELTNAD